MTSHKEGGGGAKCDNRAQDIENKCVTEVVGGSKNVPICVTSFMDGP